MCLDYVLHQYIAAGCGNCRHVSTRFDLVGNDGVGAAVELLHTPDLHCIRTRAGNMGAHGIEEVCQVHDVGFLGGVFNDRLSGQQTGSQNDIHRSAYADHVKTDTVATQTVGAGQEVDIIFRLIHIRTQRHKALNVLVDGPGCEIAAAGQRHISPVEPAQQRAHQIVAGTHFGY